VIWRIRFSKPKLIDRNGPGASLSRDLFKVRRKLQNRCGATKERSRMTFEESSGKVFGDIGFANPEHEQLKAHLTPHIYRIIKSRGLTQAEAGAIVISAASLA